MARSLDGLICHLVDQVALCGEHGALPLDFISHIKNYYNISTKDSQAQDRDHAVPHPGIASNVDRPFLEQVWKWLIKNPDIRLGSHAEHKQLTLSEVEARNAAIEQSEQSIPVSEETNFPKSINPSHASDAPTAIQDGDIAGDRQTLAIASAEAEYAAVPHGSNFHPGIRLYASKNRMWHAVAGHGPDPIKIKSFDFICLSIIAASGPKGILQHDLTRITGQDKRSLPARTDRLRDGGYIEKKPVRIQLFNPNRVLPTSQCTLKRFVNESSDQKQQASVPGSESVIKVKRIRKKGQPDQKIQLPGQSSSTVALESASSNRALSDSRTIPSWTADRSISNQIFELVDRSGIKGMSMTEIRDNLMGDHIKKPLDEHVSRLVQSWQISQPLHIRHLSIVRDTALRGKTQIYIYYTYENFKKLVESGTGFWEAVTNFPNEVTKSKNVAASLDAKPDVDEYGFPRLEESQFQGHKNDATLEECVSALKVDPLHISISDPVLKRLADGNYGVGYKGHRQYSVSTGNASSTKKAAPAPSDTASIKARAIGPQKGARSTPSCGVSAKPYVIEPEKTAASKPRAALDNAGVFEFQTLKRKRVRKPDSKRLGRPRKYPKTGVPANFETMTPDEVNNLFQSQEMFEKYEIVRMEKEIVRRIEDGETAEIVTYEVLAEWENSRKQEGELPLPKASRAQILQNFAGELMPQLDTNEANPKVRERKDTRYRPSMAAHTVFVPALRKQVPPESRSKDSKEGPPILPTRTRKRRLDVPDLESDAYLPSVAAHSWPYLRPISSAVETSTASARNHSKRQQGRLAKPKQSLGPHFKYLPSLAAHSGSYLPFNTLPIIRAGQKRKRTTYIPLEKDDEHTLPLQYKYLPSIAAHSGSFLPSDALSGVKAGHKRKRPANTLSQHDEHHTASSTSSTPAQNLCTVPTSDASMETPNMQPSCTDEGMYPGWEKFMFKYYHEHLATIIRSNGGVFIGKTAPRRKRPCEPRDFRPKHIKLAVFKSTRLRELDWFVKSAIASEPSERMSRGRSRAQTPTSQIVKPAAVPMSQGTLEGQPDLSMSTFSPPPDPSSMPSQSITTYASPYAGIVGTKRKRTTSPQPVRSTVPFDPFSASPYSRHSSPATESSKPIQKPSTLLETSALSPPIDQVHEDTIIENEQATRTLGRQPDTNESRELSPVPNQSNSTQSETAVIEVVQSSQSPTSRASKPSNQQSITKINRRGGSTAILRRNIIMEIVEKCEGIFPSHKEMSLPFAAEWKRRGQEGTPEAKTISNAVDALIKENKLRQITFTSRTRQGVALTKSMLILPSVDITDSRVKETQTKMVAWHPGHYIPTAVLPPQDYQALEIGNNRANREEASDKVIEETVQDFSAPRVPHSRPPDIAKKIMDGKERAAMARFEALKEQDQQGLDHTHANKRSIEPSAQRATTDAPNLISGTVGMNLPNVISKRSGGRRGQKRVERLAGIKKLVPSMTTPLSTMPINPVSNPIPLLWLPPECTFSDFNFEGQRPTVLMSAAGNEPQSGTLEAPMPLGSTDKPRRRIRKMARDATQNETNEALPNSDRSCLLDANSNSRLLESSHAPISPPSHSGRAPKSRNATKNTSRLGKRPYPYISPKTGEAILDRSMQPGDDLGFENNGEEEMTPLLPTSKTMQRGSPSTTASPSPESPFSGVSGWPIMAPAMLQQRALIVSFMDPAHYYHPASGTFSVTFTGLRPPRKTVARRGTASNPYAAAFIAGQPYGAYRRSTRPPLLHKSQTQKKSLFDDQVDSLLRRELEANELDNVVLVGWPFVNHGFSHAHQNMQAIETNMEAAKQVTVRLNDGRLIYRPFIRKNELRPKTGNNSVFSTGSRGIDLAVAESRTSLKRRRLTSVVELGTQDETPEHMELGYENRHAKLRRVRGPRQARSLGENGEERLLTAVMVIRALTGGLDKRIDWVLVAKVFEPTYTQMFVHSRWSLTLQKYKLVLPKMESDFQNIFAGAYEEGTIPAIDYDNLEDYDWKWLVEWTMANVDTPTRSLPELPVERSEFDGLYTLNETSNNGINEIYEIDGSSASARRTKILNRDPYVLPLIRERASARPAEGAEDLNVVRTWIRANIMTPESTYNPSAARAKLSTFPDGMVEDALKKLLLDRVLSQENKGRLVPGRNYDISDFLISRLKKNLQVGHFQRAAVYKQQFDLDFEEKGFANFSAATEDGDMIVIVNLLAHQRITVVPIDVPMNKWGQTDGGYETRQMDKRRLNFKLELRPSPKYIYGNPLTPLPAPPCQHLEDAMAKIPLWYDINGSLVPVMWKMAVAAILAVLAVRPGIGAPELEKVMRPAMEIWELQEVLEWLVHAKAAKRVGQGFSVEDEWWWLALGTGKNGEECSGENGEDGKAKGKEKEKTDEDLLTMDLD